MRASVAQLCRVAVPQGPSISELPTHHQDGTAQRGCARRHRPSRISSDLPCMNLRRHSRRSQQHCDCASLPASVHAYQVAERFGSCRSACPWMVRPPTLQSAHSHHCRRSRLTSRCRRRAPACGLRARLNSNVRPSGQTARATHQQFHRPTLCRARACMPRSRHQPKPQQSPLSALFQGGRQLTPGRCRNMRPPQTLFASLPSSAFPAIRPNWLIARSREIKSLVDCPIQLCPRQGFFA